MKLYCRGLLLFVAILFLGAGKASADTLLSYSFAGPVSASFELPINPTPTTFTAGLDFKVTPINLMINGVASNDYLLFYNTALGGAFGAFSCGSCVDLSLTGPQLYSGSEAHPTMLFISGVMLDPFPGTGGGGGTLSTPEPSAFLLLGIGLLALAGIALVAKRSNGLRVAAN